ncbi:hypothetical protein Sjap_009102 [Stephania japonica]|uniref:Uncharacterized protein n=1 Tax=Stephania japonica TaxID=461633 RepID=A0AAP0JQR9_9MAGN
MMNSSSSVHGGSHVCSKCGWAFPNPHPSAKNRRAHKRVCGRVVADGFKPHEGNNPHLSVSDDEEDHDKEEEFSDAVAEFVDASVVNQSSGGVLDDYVNGADKDIIKPLESYHNSETKSSEAMENEIPLPKSEMLSNPSPSSEPTALVSDVTVQSSNLEVNKEGNIIASISPIADPQEISPTVNTQNSLNGNSLAQIEKNESKNGKSEKDQALSTIEDSSISHEINALEDSVQSSTLASTEEGSTVTYSLSPMVDPLENAPRENIQTSENPNFLTQVDKDADSKGNVDRSLSTSETSFVCHETTGLEDSLADDRQTSENLNSSSQIVEDTAMMGKEERDGGETFLTPVASFDKTKNEPSEVNLNLGKTEKFGIVTSDVVRLDRITDVSDVNDSRANEVDRSLSTAEGSLNGSETKALAMDIDLSKAEEHAKKVPEDDTEGNDVRSLAFPINDILKPEQENSRSEASLGSCSGPAEAEAMQHVGIPVDGAQVEVEPVGTPMEEDSALHVKDCQDQKPEELVLSQSLECDEATTFEMLDDSPAHGEACPDSLSNQSDGTANISSSVVQIVEDTVSNEGTPNESAVGLVYAESECDLSEVNGTSKEALESNVLEGLSDPIISDRRILLYPIVSDKSPADSEMNKMVCSVEEQESHFSQQDLSSKTQPEATAELSVASDVMRSNVDIVNNEADNIILNDIIHEEERNENSDTTEKGVAKANIVDDLSRNSEFVSEVGSFSQIKPNLEEIMSTHLDAFKHSDGRASNVSEEENKPESSYDIQDCHGDNQIRDVKKSIDSTISEAFAGDTMVPMVFTTDEPNPVERKSSKDTHGGSENPEFEESFASATDSEPNDPSLNVAADSVISLVEGGKIDVCSRNLAEDSNDLKQQPEASMVVPPEGSIDSISQTDSIEGHWGSVSDGTVPSSRYASDSPYTFAAEVQARNNMQSLKQESVIKGANKDQSVEGTDIAKTCSANLEEPGRADGELSSLAEIQTIENQSSSLQAGTSPSLSDVLYESKGKQKTEEEIIAKVVSWSSDKSRTPLRSLLVEANLESKQKTAGNHGPPTNLPTQKDESVSTTKEGLSNVSSSQALPPRTTELLIDDSAKRNSVKEWNSPARLPNNREKRKPRYWVPFVCCSSVN